MSQDKQKLIKKKSNNGEIKTVDVFTVFNSLCLGAIAYQFSSLSSKAEQISSKVQLINKNLNTLNMVFKRSNYDNLCRDEIFERDIECICERLDDIEQNEDDVKDKIERLETKTEELELKLKYLNSKLKSSDYESDYDMFKKENKSDSFKNENFYDQKSPKSVFSDSSGESEKTQKTQKIF